MKGILQALFKLAQATLLKGTLEESLALTRHMRKLANETNNLDGATLSADLLAFLRCVLDESYIESAALARSSQEMLQEQFFGSQYNHGKLWGLAIVDCALGQSTAARHHYSAFFWKRHDDAGPGTICLALEAVALAHEEKPEAAAELLGLAFHQPIQVNGWLHRWSKIAHLRKDLVRQLGEEAYQAAWKRGAAQDLEITIQSILGEAKQMPPMIANHSLLEPLSGRELEVLGL